MYNYCQRKSLKLFLKICPLPLIWKLQLNKLSGLDARGWFQSITHSIGSEIVTLVIVLIIIFVVYRRLSIRLVNTNQTHLVKTFSFFLFSFFLNKYNKIGGIVRKHLTGGFLCAGSDLSGILCSLLIPEYSGIKRRGKPLLGAEESRHFLHQFFYTVISTLFLFMNHMVKVIIYNPLSFIWMTSCFLDNL